MINKELYNAINQDEEMTDEEKREAYFSEIAAREAEQEWQDEQ